MRALIAERLEGVTLSSRFARSKYSIKDEREFLSEEWEEIKLERDELRNCELRLWRNEDRLDQVRYLLGVRREQLDEKKEKLKELKARS